MKLQAKIIKGTKTLAEDELLFGEHESFQKQLEQCFVELCKKMGISVPIWLRKNTREFVRFGRTSFNSDQFLEPIDFDRFEIRFVR
ncbi:MAG: hypothetical protein GX494_00705 [Clostridiaceae bacterium]|nr:hypothetical protein [Clostridiaceae bacterium]